MYNRAIFGRSAVLVLSVLRRNEMATVAGLGSSDGVDGICRCSCRCNCIRLQKRYLGCTTSRHPAYLYERRSSALFESSSGDGYGYWPVTHIPKRVVQTVLTLEDRRFYSHWGVDWIAVARAVLSNVTQRRTVSGASTLAMQLARMQNPRSRTLRHKLQEMAAAIFITARHGREAVLQAYMARVPYGHRLHGLVLPRSSTSANPSKT